MHLVRKLEDILPMLKRVENDPEIQKLPIDGIIALPLAQHLRERVSQEANQFLSVKLFEALVDFVFSNEDDIYINEDNARALGAAGYVVTTQRVEAGSFEEDVEVKLSNCILAFTW